MPLTVEQNDTPDHSQQMAIARFDIPSILRLESALQRDLSWRSNQLFINYPIDRMTLAYVSLETQIRGRTARGETVTAEFAFSRLKSTVSATNVSFIMIVSDSACI